MVPARTISAAAQPPDGLVRDSSTAAVEGDGPDLAPRPPMTPRAARPVRREGIPAASQKLNWRPSGGSSMPDSGALMTGGSRETAEGEEGEADPDTGPG